MFGLRQPARCAAVSDLVLPVDHHPDWSQKEISCGTTLVAMECKDGVVLGADTRTSSGSYAVNRFTDKLTQVSDRIFCCRSGSAADTQALTDIVKYQVNVMRLNLGREPTVHMVANMFRDMCYRYRDQLSAGIIVAGWDEQLGGQVYGIPVGGMLTREKISAGGSGSTYLYGYLDEHFKPDMTSNQCLDLVKTAVALAIARDGGSGGCTRMATIKKEGVERHLILGDAVKKY